jgi:hypothetical protein
MLIKIKLKTKQLKLMFTEEKKRELQEDSEKIEVGSEHFTAKS